MNKILPLSLVSVMLFSSLCSTNGTQEISDEKIEVDSFQDAVTADDNEPETEKEFLISDSKDVGKTELKDAPEITETVEIVDNSNCWDYLDCESDCHGLPGYPDSYLTCISECDLMSGKQKLQQYKECMEKNECAKKKTQKEIDACISEFCYSEYLLCWTYGSPYKTCYDLYKCFAGCPLVEWNSSGQYEDPLCIAECIANSSTKASEDWNIMENCLLDECPDADFECIKAATKDSCKVFSQNCISDEELSCCEVLFCLDHCPQGSDECLKDCAK